MNWKNLFTPVKSLDAQQAKALMNDLPSAAYQLLDVRQPKEYEAGHLANAVLVPLRELPDRLAEFDRQKPTIVYCAVGGRSKAASQLLAGQGFSQVYNLSGGIKSWHDGAATGPEHQGFELLSPAAEFGDAITLAYAMEDGLQRFYLTLADNNQNAEATQLFTKLASFEDLHKTRLEEAHRQENPAAMPLAGPGHEPTGEALTLEGGLDMGAAQYSANLKNLTDILDLAMMLETQALDLYGRLARRAIDPKVKELFLSLADEEKNHLRHLAGSLDAMVRAESKGALPPAP